MKRRLVAVVAAIALCSAPLLGIFGFGDIVYDPWNEVHLLAQLSQLSAQYEQLVQTYKMITSQYEQMKWNARYFVSPTRWRAARTPWRMAQAPSDAYGLTGGYIGAINSGANVLGRYARVGRRLDGWASFNELPGAQADHARAQFATVEMADSAATGTMDIVGRIRANAPAVETSIAALEVDSLSDDPALNTEVAVLNKMNAALIVALRNQQDTNKLLVGLAEHRIVDTKRARDAEAAAIENDVAYRAGGRAILEGMNAGTNEALRGWRLP
jgi:hypothetical protein